MDGRMDGWMDGMSGFRLVPQGVCTVDLLWWDMPDMVLG